jgi:hypothetical protein
VVTSVAMAAINVPALQPQHLARFTVIDLVKPDGGDSNKASHQAAIARMLKAAPSLWLRALHGWDRYVASMGVFERALARSGCAPREQDQFGSLLAGWWVLTEDGVPNDAQALEGVAALTEYIRRSDEVEADDGPRRAVQFIASSKVQLTRSTDTDTIGALIERAFGNGDPELGEDRGMARNVLERDGIRPVPITEAASKHRPDTPPPRGSQEDGIWFSRTHRAMAAIFKGQRGLDDGRWVQELLRLTGAKGSARNVRFGKSPATTAVWVPRGAWDPDWKPPG